MESQTHTLANLFAQLGLPNEPRAMEAFIATHAPLADAIPLAEAAFWTPSQAAFLKAETESGRMKVEDFDQAAELFSGMVMGHSQLRSLLRLPSDKTQAEFDSLAGEAAERFMRAYAP